MRAKLSTTPQRSALMKSVGRVSTGPEMSVRRHLHRLGFRYRVNVRALPGTPDIVLARFRTVIFVHGCFWHGHDCRHGSVQARSNVDYWLSKIEANRERDARKCRALRELGWFVETIFECETADARALRSLAARIRGRARPEAVSAQSSGARRRPSARPR